MHVRRSSPAVQQKYRLGCDDGAKDKPRSAAAQEKRMVSTCACDRIIGTGMWCTTVVQDTSIQSTGKDWMGTEQPYPFVIGSFRLRFSVFVVFLIHVTLLLRFSQFK